MRGYPRNPDLEKFHVKPSSFPSIFSFASPLLFDANFHILPLRLKFPQAGRAAVGPETASAKAAGSAAAAGKSQQPSATPVITDFKDTWFWH
jgi:hypothetical protein